MRPNRPSHIRFSIIPFVSAADRCYREHHHHGSPSPPSPPRRATPGPARIRPAPDSGPPRPGPEWCAIETSDSSDTPPRQSYAHGYARGGSGVARRGGAGRGVRCVGRMLDSITFTDDRDGNHVRTQ